MFIDKDNLGIHNFTVYTYNSDFKYSATLRWFFELCQEAAALHCNLKETGITDLIKENKTWVIVREKIHITRYPLFPETLTLKTGIPESSSYYAPRSIIVFDSQNKEVMRASAMWVLINTQTRTPLKVKEVYEKTGYIAGGEEQTAFVDLNLRSCPKLNSNNFKAGKEVSVFKPQIGFPDCDINRHVNNVVYVDWILRALPLAVMTAFRITDIDIMWLHEIHAEDEIEVHVYQTEENKFGVVMYKGDIEVCLAELVVAELKD